MKTNKGNSRKCSTNGKMKSTKEMKDDKPPVDASRSLLKEISENFRPNSEDILETPSNIVKRRRSSRKSLVGGEMKAGDAVSSEQQIAIETKQSEEEVKHPKRKIKGQIKKEKPKFLTEEMSEGGSEREKQIKKTNEGKAKKRNNEKLKLTNSETKASKKTTKTAEKQMKVDEKKVEHKEQTAMEEDVQDRPKQNQQTETKSTSLSEEDEEPPKKKTKTPKRKNAVVQKNIPKGTSEKPRKSEVKSEEQLVKQKPRITKKKNKNNDQNVEDTKCVEKEIKTTGSGKKSIDKANIEMKGGSSARQSKEPKEGDPESSTQAPEDESANRSVLQLKIVLRDVTPPIWRRIQVLNTDTFGNLNEYIKEAMGWVSSASHHFIRPYPEKDLNVIIGDSDSEETVSGPDKNLFSKQETKLSTFLNSEGDMVFYDFSPDSWLHEITVEKVLPPPGPKAEYPKCTGGQRAGPPEECGGPDQYQHILEVYENPNHPEYKEVTDWLAEHSPEWDPQKFNKRNIFRRVKMWVLGGPNSKKKYIFDI